MGYELSKGTLFATVEGQTMTIGNGIPFTEEFDILSTSEIPARTYHMNSILDCELLDVDLALLNDLCCTTLPNDKFIIEYEIPIMIQARWHKKPRIRKKWLKRFGMKPDIVKIKADATAGEYHTDDGSFEFETDIPKYIWRPDQLRSGLKIEW